MRQNGKPAAMTPRDDQHDVPGGNAGEAFLARGKTMSRMQIGSYHTAIAVQQPRKLELIQQRVIQEAALLGGDFEYGWEVKDRNAPGGKSYIQGVSIDGAMILVRNWGNCVCEVAIDEDAPAHWIIRATFIDLETGYSYPRLFRQRKTQSTGKMDADRSLDIAFQIGQSKAQRNAVVKAMPTWLVNAAVDAARKSSVAKYEQDLPMHRKRAVDGFLDRKVTVEMLVRKVGAPVDSWTARDLANLASLYRAIFKENAITVEDAFAEEPEDASTATEAKSPTVETPPPGTADAPADPTPASSNDFS